MTGSRAALAIVLASLAATSAAAAASASGGPASLAREPASAAPSSTAAPSVAPSDDEVDAMLVTDDEIDGYTFNAEYLDVLGLAPGLPADAILCIEAGPVALFDEVPQAHTFLDGGGDAWVEQLISVAPEAAQQARFAEAARALDRCNGATYKGERRIIAFTAIKDPSVPAEARVYRAMYDGDPMSEPAVHIAYARVGPALTLLRFVSVDTREVLTFVHRALAKIAEATGSPIGQMRSVSACASPSANTLTETPSAWRTTQRSAATTRASR